MRIKDISPDNRPRERLESSGASTLSDAELLAIILKTGTKQENVIDMSNRLISKYGLNKLTSCSLTELQEINGIGPSKACQIIAIFELNKRVSHSKNEGKPIQTAKDVFDHCAPKLSGLNKECFLVLHLDTKNRVIKTEAVSMGILDSAIIHPREVFQSAIKENAHAIILVHNHPSGDPTPSDEDQQITEQLVEAGNLLGIKVLDHVIIGKGTWNSAKT